MEREHSEPVHFNDAGCCPLCADMALGRGGLDISFSLDVEYDREEGCFYASIFQLPNIEGRGRSATEAANRALIVYEQRLRAAAS